MPTKNHIVVISDSSFLRKWSIDLDEKEQIKVIDTTQLLENLRSYDLRECLQLKGGRWLLMTKAGDLFILGQEKLNDRTFNRKLSETSF